jgi:hypothetical protein
MLAGEEYNLTFIIDVSVNAPYAELMLSLDEDWTHSTVEDRFWEIHSLDLNLTGEYNPNSQNVTFRQIKGVYTLSTYGNIPSELTISARGGGLALHKPVDLKVLSLIGPDQSILDEVTLNIIDSKIDNYRFVHSQKEDEYQDYVASGVDPAYLELYQNFVSLAEEKAEIGLVETATDILETLHIEITPTQTGPSWQEQYFLPVVGFLLLITIICVVLFLNGKNRADFVTMIVEDQIREMEALQSRASRIDRNLAQRLQEINDKLKEAERR